MHFNRCQVGVGLYIRYGYVSSKAEALKSALARALCGLKTEEADRVFQLELELALSSEFDNR